MVTASVEPALVPAHARGRHGSCSLRAGIIYSYEISTMCQKPCLLGHASGRKPTEVALSTPWSSNPPTFAAIGVSANHMEAQLARLNPKPWWRGQWEGFRFDGSTTPRGSFDTNLPAAHVYRVVHPVHGWGADNKLPLRSGGRLGHRIVGHGQHVFRRKADTSQPENWLRPKSGGWPRRSGQKLEVISRCY